VSGQLQTTWDRALKDLAGGGVVVRVFAEPGGDPRIQVLITAREPKLLDRVNEVFLNMARQDAKNKKKPEPVRTTDYQGTVVHTLGAEGARVPAYAIVSGRLAFASSTGDLERLVDGLRANEKSSAGPSREGSPARNEESSILRGHVDLQRLRTLDPKKYT